MQLKREFGILGGMAMVASTQIGSGIFMSPQNILVRTGSPLMALVVWLAAGVFALISLFCYLELSLLLKDSGAEYSYLRHGYGKWMAFVLVWAKLVLIKPAALASALVGFADYFLNAPWIGLNEANTDPDEFQLLKKCIAVVSVIAITALNSYSVKLVKTTQKWMFYTILVPIGFILVCGAINLAKSDTVRQVAIVRMESMPETDLGTWCEAFYFAMWSYDGWQAMAYALEEMKNPNKSLKYASIGGTVLVTTLYLLMNVSYFTGLTAAQMVKSSTVATDFVEASLGGASKYMVWMVTVGILFANFNTAIANTFTTGRLTFVAARHGNLPKFMSFVSVRKRTPSIALWTNCGLVVFVLCVVSTEFSTLVKYMAFTQWMFHGLSFAAVVVLRFKMPDAERPFTVPILFPVLMTIVSAVLVTAPVATKIIKCVYSTDEEQIEAGIAHVKNYGVALSILLGALPIYFVVKPVARRQEWVMRGYRWISEEIQPLFGVVPESADMEKEYDDGSGDSTVASSLTSFRDEKVMV